MAQRQSGILAENRQRHPNGRGLSLEQLQPRRMLTVSFLPGEFNGDGIVDVADLDILSSVIADTGGSAWHSVDRNDQVNAADIDAFLALKGASYGDSNLDGTVDLHDFLQVSSNFGKEGSWSDGDFTQDGIVDFADYLILNVQFGVCESY